MTLLLEPSLALRSSLYRELRKGQLTVLELRRVQTSHMADNKAPGLLAMGDKSSLQYDMAEGSPVKSCVDYYLRLRVLAYALAWAGNYQTTNEGGRSLMLDLSTVLHYADGALTASVLPAALCYGSNAMTS